MAFVFDPSLAVIDMTRVGINNIVRTETLAKLIIRDIETMKRSYPEHTMVIDLDTYRDGVKEWETVRKNVIAGPEKIFRGRIMAKKDTRDDTEVELVKEDDGCDYRYLVLEFITKGKRSDLMA